MKLIAAHWKVGIHVMFELCQRVADGLVMAAYWFPSIVVLIFKG